MSPLLRLIKRTSRALSRIQTPSHRATTLRSESNRQASLPMKTIHRDWGLLKRLRLVYSPANTHAKALNGVPNHRKLIAFTALFYLSACFVQENALTQISSVAFFWIPGQQGWERLLSVLHNGACPSICISTQQASLPAKSAGQTLRRNVFRGEQLRDTGGRLGCQSRPPHRNPFTPSVCNSYGSSHWVKADFQRSWNRPYLVAPPSHSQVLRDPAPKVRAKEYG